MSSIGAINTDYSRFEYPHERKIPVVSDINADVFTIKGLPDAVKFEGNMNPVAQEEQHTIQKLKERDRRVRAHEAAHMAAGGGITQGGPSYSYTTGPDGRRYATAGEVQIDTSEVADNPQATIIKMEQVQRAALAPPDPSGQDRRVAAEAAAKAVEARRQLANKEPPTPLTKSDPRVKKYKEKPNEPILKKVFA